MVRIARQGYVAGSARTIREKQKPPPPGQGLMFSGPAKAVSGYGHPHKVENDGLGQPDMRRTLLSEAERIVPAPLVAPHDGPSLQVSGH